MRTLNADHYRREAELVEQAAAQISLRSDKETLLARARSLRLHAEGAEACSPDSGERVSRPAETF